MKKIYGYLNTGADWKTTKIGNTVRYTVNFYQTEQERDECASAVARSNPLNSIILLDSVRVVRVKPQPVEVERVEVE